MKLQVTKSIRAQGLKSVEIFVLAQNVSKTLRHLRMLQNVLQQTPQEPWWLEYQMPIAHICAHVQQAFIQDVFAAKIDIL